MKRLAAIGAVIAAAISFGSTSQALALEKIRVGYCARTLNINSSPFAIARKMGYFAQGGIDVEVVPLNGSTECVQNLAAGTLDFTYATADAVLVGKSKGVDAEIFYTILQKNIFGLAVPVDSPIKTIKDLRGKKIGVTSMGSTGVLVAKALASLNGLSPDQDIELVTIGEAAQSAVLLRNKQVDALSQYSTNYAMIEFAGVKLRYLDNGPIESFPSATLLGLRKNVDKNQKAAIALARGYAMATLFLMTNPAAATKIVQEVWPESQGTGRDEATAAAMDKAVLKSFDFAQDVRSLGVRWGESNLGQYAGYIKFLNDWGVLQKQLDPATFITNSLIDKINDFDPKKVEADAMTYGGQAQAGKQD